MYTYEYSVEQANTDARGMVTVQSFCRDIINALWVNSQKDSSPMVMTNSTFEINERPRLDDNFNVTITRDTEGTCRLIKVTDDEGSEIGRGKTLWSKRQSSDKNDNGVNETNRFLKTFCKMVPERILDSGLSVKIEMDFKEEAQKGSHVEFGIERKNDESYLFKALSGEKTICLASLVTE